MFVCEDGASWLWKETSLLRLAISVSAESGMFTESLNEMTSCAAGHVYELAMLPKPHVQVKSAERQQHTFCSPPQPVASLCQCAAERQLKSRMGFMQWLEQEAKPSWCCPQKLQATALADHFSNAGHETSAEQCPQLMICSLNRAHTRFMQLYSCWRNLGKKSSQQDLSQSSMHCKSVQCMTSIHAYTRFPNSTAQLV